MRGVLAAVCKALTLNLTLPLPLPLPLTLPVPLILTLTRIDSMVLARLVDLELPTEEPIDLMTVAFGATPDEAPDRLTARNGLAELVAISPSRDWRLVEVDISLEMLRAHRAHIEALLLPARTG